MSVSQIDMVVFTENRLQVCGDLSPMKEEEIPNPQSFTVVVRQGDTIATVHATEPFDPQEFHPDGGRWVLKRELEPGERFQLGPAAVSAVIVLKCEPAGLETLSWVQPVTIKGERGTLPQELEFDPKELAPPSTITPLEIGHSVSSSLTILGPDPAHPDTFSGGQQIHKVPQAHPAGS